MTELWEDVILPFTCFAFALVFIILSIWGIGSGIQALFDSKECKVWGGQYAISTGCLMKVDDKVVTLKDYQYINSASITRPIETNTNLNIITKE